MNNRNASLLTRAVSALMLSTAIIMTIVALTGYSKQRNSYPQGMTIAGVSVGGVDPQTASQRVLQVYSTPVQIQYGGAVIQIDPFVIGFQLDMDTMLAAADLSRTGASFWGGYWQYLWNREPAPANIPLSASFSEDRLRQYLTDEIAPRYDLPATPAQPIAGGGFTPSIPGQLLDVERAIVLIEDALASPTNRTVALSFNREDAARPTLDILQVLLKGTIKRYEFDGVIGVYMLDLQTRQVIHFAQNNGQELSVSPDVAFTASSTAKIPIMVSYFGQYGTTALEPNTLEAMLNMIRRSENPPADRFMSGLDEARGPLIVTEKMSALGLLNTFMAGYFFDGAPLLQVFPTPSNSRTDVDTNPDRYNQTTPSDMGVLLEDLYQCAEDGGGAFVAVFPATMNQEICQQMVEILVQDKLGALFQAGLPEGTRIAHKHGWVTNTAGVIDNVGDAAIVYTPGGNYILVTYTYHPAQIVWDSTANPLFAEISMAVYNYFNVPSQ